MYRFRGLILSALWASNSSCDQPDDWSTHPGRSSHYLTDDADVACRVRGLSRLAFSGLQQGFRPFLRMVVHTSSGLSELVTPSILNPRPSRVLPTTVWSRLVSCEEHAGVTAVHQCHQADFQTINRIEPPVPSADGLVTGSSCSTNPALP